MLSPLNRIIFVVYSILLVCGTANSYDIGPVEIHGYVASGYYRTTGNNAIDSDSLDGSIDFYETAINYNYSSGRWFTMGQAISRDVGDAPVNEEKLALDYLLLGANIINRSNFDLQFRLGQIKTPYGTMDTTDIPTTRNYPLEGYAARNLLLRSQGVVFDALFMTHVGDFEINLGYLCPEVDVEKAFDFGRQDFSASYKKYFNHVLRLKWISGDRDISVTYSTMKLQFDLDYSEDVPPMTISVGDPPQAVHMPAQTIHTYIYCNSNRYHQLIVSKLFENFKLSVTLGTAKFDQDLKIQSSLGPVFYDGPLLRGRSNDYLVRGTYDFTPKFSSGLALGYTKNVIREHVKSYESKSQRVMQITMDYAFNQNWVIKSAFSHYNGSMEVSTKYNPDGIKEKWNLFEVEVTYSF